MADRPDLLQLADEVRQALQKALEATQLENEKLHELIGVIRQRFEEQRLQLVDAQGFIAHQDQLIRFLTCHVPADLEYPEPFDRMLNARRAN